MGINFINSEFTFSLYKNLFSIDKPEEDIDINQLIELIKYGSFKDEIEKLRSAKSKDEYDQLKKESLPCVTLSGKFSHRNAKGLINHSGLIQIDIDEVKDYESLYKQICEDSYTYLCFRSPGGEGIKAVIKINPSAATHLDQFRALEKYYKEHHNTEIDKACKDVARCMLLSYDPDIFYNPFSEVYAELYVEERRKASEPFQKPSNQKLVLEFDSLNETIESIISALERGNIDLTADFNDWIKIGYALCSAFNESGRRYFHRISSMYLSYSFDEADKKYTQLFGNNTGRIGIGTLIWMAKQRGIEVNYKPVSIPKPYLYSTEKSEAAERKVEYQLSERSRRGTDKIQKEVNDVPVLKNDKTASDTENKDKRLIQKLRDLRLRLSREESISAFKVFYNSTLDELVKVKPQTVRDLYNIKGLGDKKIQWFGEDIISIIKSIN